MLGDDQKGPDVEAGADQLRASDAPFPLDGPPVYGTIR
jgi:hypothetical protein